MQDHVDQAVFLEKFSSLKSFRQILMSSLLDHAWSGETDHAFWFGNDHVAQRSKTGHDAGRGWIRENRNVRQLLFCVAGQRTTGLRHLHEAQHSFVQTRAPGCGNNDDRATLGRAVFNRTRDFLSNDGAHRSCEKPKIHHRDGYLVAVENAVSANHGVE